MILLNGFEFVRRSAIRLARDERGITALETAIILISFVVVAVVFYFTLTSAGAFRSTP